MKISKLIIYFTHLVILLLILVFTTYSQKAMKSFDNLNELNKYNITWDSPGNNSKGSMPLGNGDIGLNVWTEESGNICFYISKTDLWDENGRLLKLGKVKINISPNPFQQNVDFQQSLNLREGCIEIKAGKDKNAIHLIIWVDANHPVIRIETKSHKNMTITVGIEPWRTKLDTLKDALVSGLNFYPNIFGPMIVQPDMILEENSNRITWYHQNPKTESFKINLTMQGLDNFPLQNPLKDRIFGAVIEGEGFVKKDKKTLISQQGKKRNLNIHVLTCHPETPIGWLKRISKQVTQIKKLNLEKVHKTHIQWWEDFWNRSWIYVYSNDSVKTNNNYENEGYMITRGYILQRFINGCAGRGQHPIKFNGSIFTVDYENTEGFADYRLWGPGYWWQNTRLPYMFMPAAGDFDLMHPFFKMYFDLLPLCKYRTKLYFGHEGAYYPECINFWGTVFTGTWGDKSLSEMSERIQASGWHKYEWVGGLEMATMMYDYYLYTQDKKFLKEKLLPFADEILKFFEQHYKIDERGLLKLYPSQALETWWDCTNSLPEVAGLHYLIKKINNLPSDLVTRKQKDLIVRLGKKLPPIPTHEVNGKRMLAPAERFEKKMNVENPELYAVYPFKLYGISKPDIELAIRALENRTDRGHFGWRQDDIFMALLGLTDSAKKGFTERCTNWDKNHRFPAFWGPNYDWTPDQDHGGVLTKTLQIMLLQCDDKEIRLLPAWPKSWDADFKLHAPYNTVVEGKIHEGKIEALKVTPNSRKNDIIK